MKIDKSRFDAAELEQWNALIAKGMVDPEGAEEEMEDEKPPFPPKKPAQKAEEEEVPAQKSADPTLTAALEELATLRKSIEMGEMLKVAKKYAPLGKKEDELAETLYEMKKSNEANYNAYISVLDESLSMVEKSGLFTEIGKSAGGYSVAKGAVAKAQAKAQEIMKSDPSIDYDSAVAKAWDDPELMAEYDAEFQA